MTEPLSRDRILEAGIDLADQEGIEGLSMRNLAKALGVEAMSIYYHLPNKAALVDAMADRVFGTIDTPDEGEWRDAIQRCAESGHRVLMAHPWASSLVMSPAGSGPQPARTRYMEWLLGRLRTAGFSPELAYRGYHAVDAYILGFTAWHLGHTSGVTKVLAGRDMEELIAEFAAGEGANLPHLMEHARLHVAAGKGDGHRDFLFGLSLILDGLERARV